MAWESIRITRERNGYQVCATDPEIAKRNRDRDKDDGPSEPYQCADVEYSFDTKEQVLAFVEKAIDIALPAESYSSSFDKMAKEAMKS